jgi:hypothetical protein
MLDLFAGMEHPLYYIVLRVPPEEAVVCCATRTGDALRDPAIITDLHRQFADLGPYVLHSLDVSGLDAPATAQVVEDALASDTFRVNGSPPVVMPRPAPLA